MGINWQGANGIFVGFETPESARVVFLGESEVRVVPTHEMLPVVIHPGTAGWIPILKARGALFGAASSMGGTFLDSLAELIRPAYENHGPSDYEDGG